MALPSLPTESHAWLLTEVTELVDAARAGRLLGDRGQAFGALARTFATTGWQRLSHAQLAAVHAFPDTDRRVIVETSERVPAQLLCHWPDAPNTARARALPQLVRRAAEYGGELLLAMRLAGEPEHRVSAVRTLLTQYVENAHLAATMLRWAADQGTDVAHAAPGAFAVLLSTNFPEWQLSPAGALTRFELAKGYPLSADSLTESLNYFAEATALQESAITGTLRVYDEAATEAFTPALQEVPMDPALKKASRDLQLLHRKPAKPGRRRIDLRKLIGFTSSALGGGGETRILAAHGLVASIATELRTRPEFHRAASRVLLHPILEQLERLSRVVIQEHFLHRQVADRWKDIREEVKRQQMRDPEAAVRYSFPDDTSAFEARALYYQHALSRAGVPLGIVLRELYASALTFGPTERAYFERVAFYSARRFASDYAADTDERLDLLTEDEHRVQQVRSVLRDIEVDVRKEAVRYPQTDQELRDLADALMRQHRADGHLRQDELIKLLGGNTDDEAFKQPFSQQMLLRIRAAEELQLLTAAIAVHGTLPTAFVEEYTDLPHTRAYALDPSPERTLHALLAPSNHTLEDLDRFSRARWGRHRSMAAEGEDYEPVQLPSGEEVDAYLERNAGPFVQRPMRGTTGRPRPQESGQRGQQGRGSKHAIADDTEDAVAPLLRRR